jgi:hypothetical protein
LYGGYGSNNAVGFMGGSASNTLAYGIGDEGAMKTDMARTLSAQATPERAAEAHRNLEMALARASTVAPIRVALGLKEDKDSAKRASFYSGGVNVVVTRMLEGKSDKIEGKVLGDDDQWLILDTKEGRRRVLKSTIVDVLETK